VRKYSLGGLLRFLLEIHLPPPRTNCLRGQKRSLSRSYETAGTKTDRVDWLIDCHFLPGANGFDHGFGRLSFAEALGNVFAVEETGDVGE